MTDRVFIIKRPCIQFPAAERTKSQAVPARLHNQVKVLYVKTDKIIHLFLVFFDDPVYCHAIIAIDNLHQVCSRQLASSLQFTTCIKSAV